MVLWNQAWARTRVRPKNEIKTVLEDNDIPVDACHVKGHQDDDTDVARLPLPAQCNIWCDEGASDFLSDPPGDLIPVPNAPPMPNNPATFQLNGMTVTSDIPNSIRDSYLGKILRAFTVKKECKIDPTWTDDNYDLIDWDSCATANRRESPAVQRWAVKFQNRWQPIGERCFDAHSHTGKQCPSCDSSSSTPVVLS